MIDEMDGSALVGALLILIRLKQLATPSGRLEQDVWVNPAAVAQLRPGVEGRGTIIVFSTGTFIEVEGSPREIAAKLTGQ